MQDIRLAARPAIAGRGIRTLARPASTTTNQADSLTRFVAALCRATGAVAGCLVVREDRHGEVEGSAPGQVAQDDEAAAALAAMLETGATPAARGPGWLRDPAAPGHRALLIETPMSDGAGHVMLVFASADLDADGTIEQLLAIAPGLADAAGAMHDTWAVCTKAAEQQRLLTAAMNQSECGIIIVGADHGVLLSNPAAQAILTTRDGIEMRRGQLRPTRYHDAIRFQTALDHILALPAEGGGPSRHSMMVLLSRPEQARPLIAVIAPAAAESAEGGAAALVYVMRPELSGLHGVEAICQLHGLSPVETQLVARLIAGATLGEAAAEMRIKPDTARAYLKQVFAKTDTHRQADLIQLIIRYQRAVRGDFLFHTV